MVAAYAAGGLEQQTFTYAFPVYQGLHAQPQLQIQQSIQTAQCQDVSMEDVPGVQRHQVVAPQQLQLQIWGVPNGTQDSAAAMQMQTGEENAQKLITSKYNGVTW